MEYSPARIKVPVFYTPNSLINPHLLQPGIVLTPSDDHPNKDEGWVTLGYVSRQTPLGQGTAKGFLAGNLRIATKREVRKALRKNHPSGWNFKHHKKYSPGSTDLLMWKNYKDRKKLQRNKSDSSGKTCKL